MWTLYGLASPTLVSSIHNHSESLPEAFALGRLWYKSTIMGGAAKRCWKPIRKQYSPLGVDVVRIVSARWSSILTRFCSVRYWDLWRGVAFVSSIICVCFRRERCGVCVKLEKLSWSELVLQIKADSKTCSPISVASCVSRCFILFWDVHLPVLTELLNIAKRPFSAFRSFD